MTGAAPCGVLVVDKPEGPTSHDVVARVRRLLSTRRVGHAGTLDPMASGVLVVLVGEATKLDAYLTLHRKSYRAGVTFGRATDSLDRMGQTVAEAPVPAWLADEIAGRAPRVRIDAALDGELARRRQVPPAFSAIKVDGKRSYARARAGEDTPLEERAVEVFSLVAASDAAAAELALELTVSKGYYVRSLARDLGERLDVPAHLSALRRTASGPFTIERAIRLDTAGGVEALRAAVIPLATAAREALASGVLTPLGTTRARQGKTLAEDQFQLLPPAGVPSAWLDESGCVVAIGTRGSDAFVLHRGFVDESAAPR